MKLRTLTAFVLAAFLIATIPAYAQVDTGGGGSGSGVKSKGAYNPATVYKSGDLVSYLSATYLKIANSAAGVVPTNATYWTKLGILVGPTKLLDVTFGDVTTGNPTRGDLITAQGASPKWTKLAKGAATHVLTMGADEPGWAAVPAPAITDVIYRKWGYTYTNGTCAWTPDWEWSGEDFGPVSSWVVSPNNTVARCVATFGYVNKYHARGTYYLPTTWTGTITAIVHWETNAADATKNVVWEIKTKCAGDGDVLTGAFNTAASVTAPNKAASERMISSSFSLDVTGCSAGDLMEIDFSRGVANPADTLDGNAHFIGLTLVWVR